MPRRVVYQCDRCSATAECESMPRDWKVAAVLNEEALLRSVPLSFIKKFWCAKCWAEIDKCLPVISNQQKPDCQSNFGPVGKEPQ